MTKNFQEYSSLSGRKNQEVGGNASGWAS